MSGYELYFIIAAAATTAYTQYAAGQQAKTRAKAEAAWHRHNAKVAQREEAAEREATAFEAGQQKRAAEQRQAQLRAAVGVAGVEMEGSPLLVAEDMAAQFALENAMIRTTGSRRAMQWRTRSILDVGKASAAEAAASGYARQGTLSAGASILGGAAQVGYMKSQDSTFTPWRT